MNKLKLLLTRFALWAKKYRFTRMLYRFYDNSGLIRLKHHLFLSWSKKPIQKMEAEKRFFSEHAQELKAVYDSLEDDRSRSVFENILKFRVTYDWTFLSKASANDTKTQYFVSELHFSDHETILDCGAYTGDTAKKFFESIPNCKVIALEPDGVNFAALSQLRLERLTCVKAGAWSEDTTLVFSDLGGGTASGTISDSGNIMIEVKALDRISECQSATYIKMDIEGAELEALKGAKNIIKSQRPKLAICLYHRPQDFFEIPLYIKKIYPDYKLFCHHHSYDFTETVLYAV